MKTKEEIEAKIEELRKELKELNATIVIDEYDKLDLDIDMGMLCSEIALLEWVLNK